MSFTTAMFGFLALVILIHSLWSNLPRGFVYTMLLLLAGSYVVVTFPVGNLLFATGGSFLIWLLLLGGTLVYAGRTGVIILLVITVVQPLWWILQLHFTGVGTDFSGGYTGDHLVDSLIGADFKGLIFVGISAYAAVHLHQRATPVGLEPLVLALIAVTAGLVTFNVDNLVTLYLNLELQALALYTLVGYHKDKSATVDSALRYLLAGSLISAITLVGFVQLYGLNGTFQLSQMHFGGGTGSIWVLGMLLFKLGAAPFYFWTPTVYQPLDLATLALVVGPAKVNLWFLLVVVFAPLGGDPAWGATLAVAGLLSVGVGAVGGYFQSSATSLLAYSGVLNTGYLLLLASTTAGETGPTFNFSFYLGMYVVSTSAVVVVLSLFPQTHLQSYSFWSRLGKTTPLILYYLVLNLAGLPVFPGFFAKMYLVQGILPLGWLTVVLVVAFSIIPGLYYAGVAAQALFAWSQEDNKVTQPGRWSSPAAAGLLLLGAATLSFIWIIIM